MMHHSKGFKYHFSIFFILVTGFAITKLAFPTISGETPSEIVKVGIYDNKPKIYMEDGEVKGFFADIVNEIAKNENWEVEYVYGTWAEGLERLENNEIDIMVDVALSEERKEIYDFNTETVLINWAAIYTKSGVELDSFYDLEGKKVAVMKGGIHYIGPLGIKNIVESFNIPNVEFVDVDIYADVFNLIDKGEVDAGIVNRIFGIYNEQDYNVARSNVVFNPVELRFAFTKGSEKNAQLITAIDSNLGEMKGDYNSVYYEAMKEYLAGSITKVEVTPEWVKTTLMGAGAVGAIILIYIVSTTQYNVKLKRTVNERTKELRESKEKYEMLYKQSQEKVHELEILTKAAVGRELEMSKLKEKIKKNGDN